MWYAGNDECYAAAQQAQQGGAGDGLAHPLHVCAAASHVHHWSCCILSMDPPPIPQAMVKHPLPQPPILRALLPLPFPADLMIWYADHCVGRWYAMACLMCLQFA